MAKSTKSGKGTDANRDPITKAPGAHPIGTGVGAAVGGAAGGVAAGAAAGAMTGAAAGTAAGPIGTAAGVAVGAVIGGLAGKAIGEKIDPTAEDAYWREYYTSEPYYVADYTYEDYAPAYRVGYEGYARYGGNFDAAENQLRGDYDSVKGRSRLAWERAKDATRAAWNRVERAIPGDSDRDGN